MLRVPLATQPTHETPKFFSKVRLPALSPRYPVAYGEGRIVADMLRVAAFRFGHPFQLCVLMKSDNLSRHAFQLALWLRHSGRSGWSAHLLDASGPPRVNCLHTGEAGVGGQCSPPS
jgi:hypothetical protein